MLNRRGNHWIHRFSLALCLALAGLLPMSVSVAQPPAPQVNPLRGPAHKALSLEQAIARVRAAYQAKVLSASEIQSKGPLVYQIRILLPNGRVRTVFVDGVSGEVFE